MEHKRELRIVFMGTPDFAVASLKALIDNNYNVVGVITAPDKKSGRGQKINTSAVKKFAESHNLNLLQPTNLKSEEFVNALKALNANLQIVVAFRMLPKIVWQMPEFGTFNLHASLLPQYRGAAPIHWAIINGEEKTGVTTFFIDEKIDTGAIIESREVSISENTTVGVLHDTLMQVGSELLVNTVKLIENNDVETRFQTNSKDLKTAYKLNKDNCKIDWTLDLNTIYNKIRGLNPFPSAWCYLKNGNTEPIAVKIFEIEKQNFNHTKTHGSISITDKTLKVYCKNGLIIIKNMQLPGKRKMEVKDLLNGYSFTEDAKLL